MHYIRQPHRSFLLGGKDIHHVSIMNILNSVLATTNHKVQTLNKGMKTPIKFS